MNYLTVIIPKLISFLILIGLGYLIARIGVIRQEGMSTLSGLLIRVVLPCLTVSLMDQRGTDFAALIDCGNVVLGQILGYLLLAIVGILCSHLLKLQSPTSNVHQGCMVGGNYAFVVIPMMMAMYAGTDAEQYVPICSAVDTIVVWTLGITLFTRGTSSRKESLGKLLPSRLLNPIIVAIVGMLVLNSLKIRLPATVLSLCGDIGSISYTLGLIYVGCGVCFLKKGSSTALKGAFVILLTKLLIVPLIVYITASRFLPEAESIILMLIMAAPSMTTSVMVANQYQLDQDYAATAVFVTTLGCLVALPVLFLAVSVLH